MTSCSSKSFSPPLISTKASSMKFRLRDFFVVECTESVEPLRIEQEVVDEINLARTNPQLYVQFLRERIPHYEGTLFKIPDQKPIRTKEGLPAVMEAVAEA